MLVQYAAEQLLNCISAAATQKKVSPKVKSGYPSPAMQAAALYEQEQQMRKKAYKKRKLQGLEGSSKPMAMHVRPFRVLFPFLSPRRPLIYST